MALARLGTPTSFLGRVSTGMLGELLREHLARSGVDLTASVRTDDPAALPIAAVDEHGRASYEFYLNGCADWQWRAEELARLPADTACIHTGFLALVLEPGGPLIEDLLARYRGRGTVCIDPNVWPGIVEPAAYRAGMARWSRLADIVRLSDEEGTSTEGPPDRPRGRQRGRAGRDRWSVAAPVPARSQMGGSTAYGAAIGDCLSTTS